MDVGQEADILILYYTGTGNSEYAAKKFYATDACIGCGKCTKVCPLNNVNLRDRKPVWGNQCTHCMACICKCPEEAIEYGKKSKGKPRYQCPL